MNACNTHDLGGLLRLAPCSNPISWHTTHLFLTHLRRLAHIGIDTL